MKILVDKMLVDKMLHMVWYDQREDVQCSIPIILKSALFSTNCYPKLMRGEFLAVLS